MNYKTGFVKLETLDISSITLLQRLKVLKRWKILLSNDPYSFSKNSRCLEGAFGVEVFMISVSVEVISICMVAINCMNLCFHLLYFHNFFFHFSQWPKSPKFRQKIMRHFVPSKLTKIWFKYIKLLTWITFATILN